MDENNQELSKQIQPTQSPVQTPQPLPSNKTHSLVIPKILIGISVIIILFIVGLTSYILSTKINKPQLQQVTVKTISVSPTQPLPTTSINISPVITIGPLVSVVNWKTFTDPNYSYSFQYPLDWQAQGFPQKGDVVLPLGTSSENTTYGIRFTIPNTLSPNDSALYVSVNLYNNDKNVSIEQWVNTHHVTYDDIQENHKYNIIMINNNKGIKDQITDTNDPRFDESFYINDRTKDNKSIIFAISIGGNGEGSTKLYSLDDPFVKKELPIFETLVNSVNFISQNQMPEWKTYINASHKVSFSYPQQFYLQEQDNSSRQFIVTIKNSVETFTLDIQPTQQFSNIMSRAKSTTIVNGVTWGFIPASHYCDAGQCSDTSAEYVTSQNSFDYQFILSNQNISSSYANQILSTFKFTK